MDYYQVIWFIGCVLVLLSWYKKIPVWVGWLGFLAPTIISGLITGFNNSLEFMYLWITGAVLIVISWLPIVHRVFGWTGLFLSVIASGMEWIASVARYHFPEPFVLFSSEIDLVLYLFIGLILSNEGLCRYIKRSPKLMQQIAYINYLHSMSDYWHRHPASAKYKHRANVFSIRSLKELWCYYEMMGSTSALSALATVPSFLLIAINYYNTSTEFSFYLFSCNWFWATLLYLLILEVPLFWIQERLHDVRIMVSDR